ncbi:hypothetical protein D3C83_110060 [compost metagenome]
MKFQQTLLHIFIKLDSHRAHVANNLILRFLKGEDQCFLAPFARSFNEVGGDGALSRAGRS